MEKTSMTLLVVIAVVAVAAMMFSSGGITGAASANSNAACVILPNDNGKSVFAGDGMMQGGNTCIATLTEDGPETCLNACSAFGKTKDLFDAANKPPGCADGFDTDGDSDVDCNDSDCDDSIFCATPEADLELISINGLTNVMSTDIVGYDVTFRNNGPDLASSAMVTLGFPAGINVITPPPGGNCAGGTCFYPAFDVTSGSTVTTTTVFVQWSGFAGSQRFAEADVDSLTFDPNSLNNGGIISVNIV